MSGWNRRGLFAALAIWALSAGMAGANESLAELPLGGLALPLAGAPAVATESMDVRVTPETVVVAYRFVNRGEQPAVATLAFRFPELDFSDPDASYAIPGTDPTNFIGLSARVAGKPVRFGFTQTAMLNGRDVSAQIRRSKLPLVPVARFQSDLAAMPLDARDRLVEQGLVIEAGTDQNGNALLFPGWTVRTSAGYRYSFPPGQPVDVEIRYRTSVGISPDTVLRRPLRNEPALAVEVRRLRESYCVDNGFLAGLDKITAAAVAASAAAPVDPGTAPGDANVANLRERRIVFALQGNAGAGPIPAFRMVVDKGRADRLVSFCLDNLKRISPTAFEMRATDFTPDRDLRILLVGRS